MRLRGQSMPSTFQARTKCYDILRWQSVNARNWLGCSWQWIWQVGGRPSFRDRSWRRVCSSRLAVWSLVCQMQSFLLLNCGFLCCSSIVSRSEKSAVITKQKKLSSSRKNSFVVDKYCFRLARTLLWIKNVNFMYRHYRILISLFFLFLLLRVLQIDGRNHGFWTFMFSKIWWILISWVRQPPYDKWISAAANTVSSFLLSFTKDLPFGRQSSWPASIHLLHTRPCQSWSCDSK